MFPVYKKVMHKKREKDHSWEKDCLAVGLVRTAVFLSFLFLQSSVGVLLLLAF